MSNRPISGLFGAAFTLRASAFDFAAYSAVKVIARNGALILIVAVGLALSSIACFAEDKIGNAITIKNQVEGVTAGGTQSLTTGSEVYSNELVRTVGQSMAQLLFVDNTNLSIGPLSTIRLDSFVYDPNASKGNVVLRAGVGAFRFITGLQDKKSYAIKTEFATIGVRGTEFYLLNTSSEVRIQLVEGTVFGTTISGQNFSLDQVNEVLSIDSKGQVHYLGISNKPLVDLADLGPPITQYAGLYPPPINLAGGFSSRCRNRWHCCSYCDNKQLPVDVIPFLLGFSVGDVQFGFHQPAAWRYSPRSSARFKRQCDGSKYRTSQKSLAGG